MKLLENQKNGFYIALTVFLVLCFGLVVFFIVQHFRNKNNCTPNCNGKNCGDNGCKGNCGTCPSGQTCGQDGSCSGESTCPAKCNGINCGDGCTTCTGNCPSGQTCGQDGSCSGPVIDNKEVYFYDLNRYQIPYLTNNTVDGKSSIERNQENLNYIKATATGLGASFATSDQLFTEWKNGLDSCNVGWVYDPNNKNNAAIPFRTGREQGSGCEEPNTSNPYFDGFRHPSGDPTPTDPKWGVFLYGVKPNLPDCNGGTINLGDRCVGNYAPGKISKYSP